MHRTTALFKRIVASLTQVIQLPRNSISLYGNQSTDDHDSLSYEWSLSPESKDKVVEMQVGHPGTTRHSVAPARVSVSPPANVRAS